MIILQFTMGLIMGIYLLEILTGQGGPLKVLVKLATDDPYPKPRKGDRPRNHFGDSCRLTDGSLRGKNGGITHPAMWLTQVASYLPQGQRFTLS